MNNNLPEAPVTMFTNYKRTDGFEVSLTLRGEVLEDVATALDTAIKLIIKAGGTPAIRGYGKPQVPTKPCPKHKEAQMKQNKNGNWFHTKGAYPDFTYCNGFGFPDERQANKEPEVDRGINEGHELTGGLTEPSY